MLFNWVYSTLFHVWNQLYKYHDIGIASIFYAMQKPFSFILWYHVRLHLKRASAKIGNSNIFKSHNYL